MKRLLQYISIGMLCMSLSGCAVFRGLGIYSGPTDKNTKKIDASQAELDKKKAEYDALKAQLEVQLEAFNSNKVSQGSVFVYGTGQALNRVTNQEPAVALAKDLNTMAAQALPKPPTDQVIVINKAVDNSLSTNKTEQVSGKKSIDALEVQLAKTEEAMAKMEAKMDAKIAAADYKVDNATKELNKVADAAAVKANKYDEANSMWGSFKLFMANFWKFIVFGSILFILAFIAWTAAKIYFPPLQLGENIVKGISSSVLSRGWTEIVKGGELFKTEVKEKGPVLLEDFKKGLYTGEEVITELLNKFRVNQERAQGQDVQKIVKDLTKT